MSKLGICPRCGRVGRIKNYPDGLQDCHRCVARFKTVAKRRKTIVLRGTIQKVNPEAAPALQQMEAKLMSDDWANNRVD